MELNDNNTPKSPPTKMVVGHRRKPKAKKLTDLGTTDILRQEIDGKLLQSWQESPSTDKVDVPGDLVINFIDIGQGNCTFIECPGGETILIDCGSVTKGQPKLDIAALAREFILSRLTKGHLDYLVISHPDKDHMNLVDQVLKGVTVGKLLCGGHSSTDYSGKGKDDGKKYLDSVAPDGNMKNALIGGGKFYTEHPATPEKSRLIQCKQGMDVFVVSANADTINASIFSSKLHVSGVEKLVSGTVANTACIVLCLRYKKRQVLICGDATFSTEYAMLTHWGDQLKSDALEGGHHGSADSFSDEFLARVNPTWIHFSADNKSTFRHPTWEVVERVIKCCPGVVGSSEYGPHGIVIGPKKKLGEEYQKKKQEFIDPTPRVKQVLAVMKEKKVAGKAALKAVLPVWYREGEWKKEDPTPPKPISEQWVCDLLFDCTLAKSMDTELVAYWGDRFDEMAAEAERIAAMSDTDFDGEAYWDWSVFDFNLFTTLTTANLGVYWVITITPEGEFFTDRA